MPVAMNRRSAWGSDSLKANSAATTPIRIDPVTLMNSVPAGQPVPTRRSDTPLTKWRNAAPRPPPRKTRRYWCMVRFAVGVSWTSSLARAHGRRRRTLPPRTADVRCRQELSAGSGGCREAPFPSHGAQAYRIAPCGRPRVAFAAYRPSRGTTKQRSLPLQPHGQMRMPIGSCATLERHDGASRPAFLFRLEARIDTNGPGESGGRPLHGRLGTIASDLH